MVITMLISSMHLTPVELPQFPIEDEIIMPTDSFRILGVQFDSKMRLDKQIASIVKMSFVNLKDMYQVRSCLSLDSSKTMVYAFITNCLDCIETLFSVDYPKIKLRSSTPFRTPLLAW